MTITKATPDDAGCYVDGHWGQYGTAHMINVARMVFGFDDDDVIDLANRHLESMGPSTAEGLTDDEHAWLMDASEEVENWLNENVAPESFSFGWYDGEFYLWSDEQWEEGAW